MLERLHDTLGRVSHVTAILGGYALLFLSLAICAEIIMRRTVGISMQGVDEMGGYVLAGVVAFGFAYTLFHRGHTRIDIFLGQAAPSVQAALNILAALVMAVVAIFMTWRAVATFQRSWELGSIAATPLQTPIWIPQAVWVAGLGFFAVTAVILALRAMSALAQGADEVNSVSSPPSLSQEIEAEISAVETKPER